MVGHVVIDRPHRMNTISEQVLEDLDRAIDLLEDDDEIRAICLTGEGDRAFSAGADFQSMAASGADPLEGGELSREGQRVFGKLEACDLPTVAGIDGYCLGGGMELAASADLRVASDRSEFGQPELNLGLIPGWGGTQRLPKIVGEVVRKKSCSPPTATTPRPCRLRLRQRSPRGRIGRRTRTRAGRQLAGGPPIANKFTKRALPRRTQRHRTPASSTSPRRSAT
ncbi:enoyl-CoA hydratase/isomerase family protein [Natrarchaeobaculum aegyptiacum]|uniref:enoyl-CoA hydratase/isomerase family protein n=1 Tax=Natrarchaeobaculum aegyptiacum TaxID=745377 RepID=UPI0037425BE1